MFRIRSRPPLEGAAWLPLDYWKPSGASLLVLTEVSAARCREILHIWVLCIDPLECAELHSRRTPNAESKCHGHTHQNVCSASGKRPMCSDPSYAEQRRVITDFFVLYICRRIALLLRAIAPTPHA